MKSRDARRTAAAANTSRITGAGPLDEVEVAGVRSYRMLDSSKGNRASETTRWLRQAGALVPQEHVVFQVRTDVMAETGQLLQFARAGCTCPSRAVSPVSRGRTRPKDEPPLPQRRWRTACLTPDANVPLLVSSQHVALPVRA